MENITVNKSQRVYVIPCDGGYSCLGFDVAEERTRAICAELNRPELLPPCKRGTIAHYLRYTLAIKAAHEEHMKTGRRLACELTPQLIGLENKRVEVVDVYGEKRRFYVGKSTGFIPIHLEISRRNSTGGGAVMGAPFKSVRVVGVR